MQIDHYRTLEVDPAASTGDLRAAYLRLARAHHPDQFDGPARQSAQLRMQEINEAWNVVGTPHKRRAYDEGRPRADAGRSRPRANMRGRTHFSPFDEDFESVNVDVDLDPTPLIGSRAVPRWVSLMPVLLFVWSVLLLGFGLLMNTPAIVAFAVIVFLLAGCGFLMMPLIVMSRAEKDPGL